MLRIGPIKLDSFVRLALLATWCTSLSAAGCAATPSIQLADQPPSIEECDYIHLRFDFDGWSIAIYRDSSYNLRWGQTGVHVLVPAPHSPLDFQAVYHQMRRLPLSDRATVDDSPASVEFQSERNGVRLTFLGGTDSTESIREILAMAQEGGRPFWPYEMPTLDELQQRSPLTGPSR